MVFDWTAANPKELQWCNVCGNGQVDLIIAGLGKGAYVTYIISDFVALVFYTSQHVRSRHMNGFSHQNLDYTLSFHADFDEAP